ncbi:hypothetical protein QWJ34_06110 [Saccharibacillus sp. CPCC 101409]|uniref:hypothetical protein n=1 Tax=Saccharibacillus sp. CPCC 101409 TaxID=3058041 RepID=UPI0026731EDC|nr:hypothetical protein [Saccharibacillus sp. CPCC 101409]MDO3409329.1 hypothetical protein [Saccharibacillus sp. CPCC 101409]
MLKYALTDSIRYKTLALFAEHFGISPARVNVMLDGSCLVICAERFLQPIVESMIHEESHGALQSTRELMTGYLIPELCRYVCQDCGLSVDLRFYDWNDEDLSCMIFMMLSEPLYLRENVPYPGQSKVHRHVAAITYEAQKFPDKIYSYWLEERLLIIIREGTLIEVEKALVKDGHTEALRMSKRKVEKPKFASDKPFSEETGRSLDAVYLDWAFHHDLSVLVYVFNKPPRELLN